MAPTVLVDGSFEIAKERGSILDFVDDDRGLIATQECLWVLFCLFGFRGQIKRYECVIGKEASKRGSLAGLPRSK